ncbi:coproporphyrinogen III oxidase family protein [Cystobacter fuscus]|uniref:coproporphyrinogen-III oxidase family protein n=1 Tax=Cystobacter fuscus TaxID=43 RepID=UPI002B294EF2|nr:coproporphyrinogen III oxidase family protein [Cystobacter fuscus]
MSTGERPAPDELTRRGFVTHYPPSRYWRPEGLRGLLDPRPLNVYVHSPYCIQRCAYCHYKTTTLAEHRKAEIDAYVSALCREIALVSRRFHLKERPTISVYFGGGTPTLLSREHLSRLMESLREHLTLEEPELTLEAEPVTLTPSKAEHLQALGVNRISLGIQSFHDDILRRTGRHDTEQHAFKAIALAKATGAIVNVDLMSGLAGESDRTWAYTIERALEANVHSLTVYKTELHANTDYYADLKRHTLTLPTDDEELRFITHALEQFERHDYQPVNFFTFTRGGAFRQRHISSRWLGTDTYGFGVSAFGSLDAHVMQNTSDLPRYLQTLEAGELPLTRGYRLSARELMTREAVLGMKLIHLDLTAFQQRHGFDLARWCAPVVEELEKNGFVTLREHTLSLTRKGILWGDYVGRRLAARIESLA